METMETLTMDEDWAWCYHTTDQPFKVRGFAKHHSVVLDSRQTWCATHAPQSPCACGQYALAWVAEVET
jgi:hypothetical protein